MQKEVTAPGVGEGTSFSLHQGLGEEGGIIARLCWDKVSLVSSGFGFQWTSVQILHWPFTGFFGQVS